MKALLLILVLFIVGLAAAPVSDEGQAQILQSVNKNDGYGNYEFSFETSNGLRRGEFGTLVNKGQPDEHTEVQGYYSYTDPDGNIITVNYTADENGYHIHPSISTGVAAGPVSPAVVATLLG